MKRDSACETLSPGPYFLTLSECKMGLCCPSCHPGVPRRIRTAATEPAERRSQILCGAYGCSGALCWCHFSRVRGCCVGVRMEWTRLAWEYGLVSGTEPVLSTEETW